MRKRQYQNGAASRKSVRAADWEDEMNKKIYEIIKLIYTRLYRPYIMYYNVK